MKKQLLLASTAFFMSFESMATVVSVNDYVNNLIRPQLTNTYYQPKTMTGITGFSGQPGSGTPLDRVEIEVMCTDCGETLYLTDKNWKNTTGGINPFHIYDSAYTFDNVQDGSGAPPDTDMNAVKATKVSCNTESCIYAIDVYQKPVKIDFADLKAKTGLAENKISLTDQIDLYRQNAVVEMLPDNDASFTLHGGSDQSAVQIHNDSSVVFTSTDATHPQKLFVQDFKDAVSVKDAKTVDLDIATEFRGNKRALNIDDASAKVTLKQDTSFYSNKTEGNGGAVLNNGSLVADVGAGNLVFASNIAQGRAYNGGAVYNAGSLDLTKSVVLFEKNETSDGGLTSSDNANGGAVYNGNQALFGQTVFLKNKSFGSGGAVYNNGRMAFEGNTDFSENTAENGTGFVNFGGGAILNRKSIVFTPTLSDGSNGVVRFEKNHSEDVGGAILNAPSSDMAFTKGNVVFRRNTAKNSGGAVFNQAQLNFTGTDSVLFDDNSAKEGGAVSSVGGNLIFGNNTVFQYNKAQRGASLWNSASVKLGADTIFVSNEVTESGAAVYNTGDVMYQVTSGHRSLIFKNNKIRMGSVTTDAKGGAVYNDGQMTLKLQDAASDYQVVFENNTVIVPTGNAQESNGGAIFNKDKFTVEKGKLLFHQNAAHNGGAIFNEGQFLFDTTSDIRFEDNKAYKSGGAIYSNVDAFSSARMNMGKVSFLDNKAMNGSGGAVYTNTSMNFQNALFLNNSVQGGNGGALAIENNYTGGTGNIRVKIEHGAIFSGNTAKDLQLPAASDSEEPVIQPAFGGAIYLKGKSSSVGKAILELSGVGANEPIEISKNKLNDKSNGVYMDQYSELVFNLNNNVLNLNDPIVSAENISGENDKKIIFTKNGGENGNIYLNASQDKYLENVSIQSGNFYIAPKVEFFKGDIKFDGDDSVLHLSKNAYLDVMKVNSLDFNGHSTTADLNIDFTTEQIDHFEVPEPATAVGNGVFNVTSLIPLNGGYLINPDKTYYVVQTPTGESGYDTLEIVLNGDIGVWGPLYRYKAAVNDFGNGIIFEKDPLHLNTFASRFNATLIGSYANTQTIYDLTTVIPRRFVENMTRTWVKPFATDEDLEISGMKLGKFQGAVPNFELENDMKGIVGGIDVLSWVWGDYVDFVMSGSLAYAKSDQTSKDATAKIKLADINMKEMMAGLRGTLYIGDVYFAGGAMFGQSKVSMDALRYYITPEQKTTFTRERGDSFDIQKLTAYAKAGFVLDIGKYASFQPTVAYLYTQMNPKGFTASSSAGRVEFEKWDISELSAEARLVLNFDEWRPLLTYKQSFNLDQEESEVRMRGELVPVGMEYDDYAEYGIGLTSSPLSPLQLETQVIKRTGGRDGWGFTIKGWMGF